MRPKEAQRYYVPEIKAEVKVEAHQTQVYVAHLPSGPERVGRYEMSRTGWIHLGPWDRKEDTNIGILEFCKTNGHTWSQWMKNHNCEGQWKICKRCLEVTTEGVA